MKEMMGQILLLCFIAVLSHSHGVRLLPLRPLPPHAEDVQQTPRARDRDIRRHPRRQLHPHASARRVPLHGRRAVQHDADPRRHVHPQHRLRRRPDAQGQVQVRPPQLLQAVRQEAHRGFDVDLLFQPRRPRPAGPRGRK